VATLRWESVLDPENRNTIIQITGAVSSFHDYKRRGEMELGSLQTFRG